MEYGKAVGQPLVYGLTNPEGGPIGSIQSPWTLLERQGSLEIGAITASM
jgi:hypothetical protein